MPPAEFEPAIPGSQWRQAYAPFPRVALPLAAALPSVDVMDVEEEVLTPALLHKRIYKKKKVFNKCLAQCLPCIGLFLFISVRR
jgi:hypothetical protein